MKQFLVTCTAQTLALSRRVRETKILSKKTGLFFVFVMLAVGAFAVTPAHGVEFSFTTIGNGIMWIMTEALLALSRMFLALTVFALKFFIEIAKYNGYIDAPTVKLGWATVRDVANMFFVVVLLVIAFGTILGIEQYSLSKTLVKFVLAAILINFSNLIAGLIIDVAHVFTMTFLNAVSATAGGNLINIFHLNEIYNITGRQYTESNEFQTEIFGTAFLAFMFTAVALMSIGAYLIVMILRMVVLWMLIIMSPLAFILGVLPQTKKYAQEWWDEFINHVLVAPIMVFFLWLAFATLGTGSFVQQDLQMNLESVASESQTIGGPQTGTTANQVSLSEASTWENIANFAVAIAFLFAGLERVQKLGARGGGFVSGVTNFAKKVGTIASGYAAGRWLVDKGKDVGEGALGVPGKLTKAAFSPIADRIEAEKLAAKANLLSLGRREEKYVRGGVAGRFMARRVRGYIKRKKKIKKLEGAVQDEGSLNYAQNEAELAQKGLMGGTFSYQFKERGADGNVLSDEIQFARDRYLEGRLNKERERKSAKDKQIQSLGELEVAKNRRLKDGTRKGDGTIQDEIAKRNFIGGGRQAELGRMNEKALEDYMSDLGNKGKVDVVLRQHADAARQKLDFERDKEYREARAEADAHMRAGDDQRAKATMTDYYQRWDKKDEELFSTGGYAQRMRQTNDAIFELAEIEDKMKKGDRSEATLKRHGELVRARVMMTKVNNKLDLEDGRDAKNEALQAAGWTESINSPITALRAELTSMLGYVVGKGLAEGSDEMQEALEEAIQKFNSAYETPELRQAALTSLLASQKKLGATGDARSFGLISENVNEDGDMVLSWGEGMHFDQNGKRTEKVYDKRANIRDPKVKKNQFIKPVKGRGVSDDEYEGSEDYFVPKMDVTKMDRIDGVLQYGLKENGKLGINGAHARHQKYFASLFAGKDSRALKSVKSDMWGSINDLGKAITKGHISDDGVKEFQDMMQEAINGLQDYDAQVSFMQNTQDLVDAIEKETKVKLKFTHLPKGKAK